MPVFNRCWWCDAEYEVEDVTADEHECPRCACRRKAQEQQANQELTVPTDPWKYSKSAMRERLSLSGERDE